MRLIFPVLLALLGIGYGSCARADAPILLADNGKAAMPIILADDASSELQEVADELAHYLGRISGAAFAVERGDGTGGIVLGAAASFPVIDAGTELMAGTPLRQRERYLVRSEEHRLLLLGATEQGAVHAAYHLLRHLGCRWFFPAAEWEVIPSQARLVVELDAIEEPAMPGRRIWYGFGFFDRNEKRCQQEYADWVRRNRLGHSLNANTGHAWQSIIRQYAGTFEEHPEYLALVDGKRQGEQLCVSNPGLRQLVVDYALDYFVKHPRADMVSLDCSDGGGQCECEPCAAMGSISNRVFGLANEAAREVARVHPGKMVGLLAYNEHSEPPDFVLEPNVYIELTRGFIRGRYSFDELMDLWPTKCAAMGYYDYYSVYLWDWDMPPGGRAANTAYIAESIRDYVARNAVTLSCESGNNWGIHGRGYYLAGQLMWNPAQDADAILNDFLDAAFGPAAAVMKRYYERLDGAGKPLVSEHLFALCLRDLEEATRIAAEAPEILARLDQLKQYMHYVRLRWDFQQSTDVAARKQLALAILTHVYRNRYSYMNHWEAIRQHQTRKWAEEFEEPTWAFNEATRPKAWQVEEANTAEETAAQFADDLARFEPQQLVEREFSEALVPAESSSSGSVATNHGFQGGVTYLLYSREGEALDFAITTGVIAGYRDRRDATWTLRNVQGTTVEEGRLPLDGESHAVTVPVPASGLYRLEIVDSSAGFRLVVPAGRPAVLALERGRKYHHFGHMPRVYFHVPAGTEALSYFIVNSTPHRLYTPDGELFKIVEESGSFITIPVPEGSDGKTWSMSQLALGQLWFFNLPPYLAASPEALLVPRE